jgi:hypothetical protein
MADYDISNVARRVVYAASGTGPYAFTFEILSQTDIDVYRGDTLLTLTTDYSVTINANGTGSVTLVTTAGTSNITIVGARNIQRTTDFVTGGDFFANTLNDELDSQTIFIQQVAETAERGLKAPVTDPTDINMTLPRKTDRASRYLAFDAQGNPAPGPTAINIDTVAAISADIVTVSGISSNVTTVANNSANVTTVANNIGNVNTVAGVSSNVTTVAGSISNVNTVASDLNEPVSEINTVAVNIANVNATGTNIASVNSVATNETNINTVAGQISPTNIIATVAGISANITTVAGISSNVTTVATNNSNVTTVAGNISNVNAVGGNISNVNSVAGNATNINAVNSNSTNINAVASNNTNISTVAGISSNVTTVAGISSAVSTVSGNSANVSTVAGISGDVTTVSGISANVTAVAGNNANVTTVAGNIASVNTVATNVSSVNSFGNVYQGAFSTAPTTRTLSGSLLDGDLYFNTTSDQMFVYGVSSGWVTANTSVGASIDRQRFIATASQTTFTITSGYTVNQIDVFLNGVKQWTNDYTATDGSTVVLATGASVGTEVEVVVYRSAIISSPVLTSADSDEFVDATAYDQRIKMNTSGKPYFVQAAVAPTLDFKFSANKSLQNTADGTSPITFTRATSGTFFDASGVMQTGASGAPRFTHDPANSNASLGLLVEPQRTNLALASQQFDQQNLLTQSNTFSDAAWTKTRSTVTGGQSDPFGGSTAFKLAEDTSTNTHLVSQTATVGATGIPAVISFYAKAAERNWVAVYQASSTYAIAYFDLQNGVVGSSSGTVPPTNLTITSVGSGWYRCSIKVSSSATTIPVGILTATADNTGSYTGTTGSGILIYGAQVERTYGTTPSAYYETTSPNWQPWVTLQTTVTPAAGSSPDGTNNAYKVVAVNGQTLNSVGLTYLRTSALTTTSGVPYSVSVYAKAAGYNVLTLRLSTSSILGNSVAIASANFNLSTGVAISTVAPNYGYNYTIQSVGNGWYRCSITGLSAATLYYAGIVAADSSATTANGTDGILLWGMQVEQAENTSTYIRTTTASATRNADVVTVANGQWLSQTEGTFRLDRQLRSIDNNQTLFSLDNGTTDVEARTVVGTNSVNLFTNSEQFNAASWAKTRSSVSPNVSSTSTPDGTYTADKLVEDTTSNNSHLIGSSVSVTSGLPYTFSVYLKAAERSYAYIRMNNVSTWPGGATTPSFYVNLTDGVITNATGISTNVVSSVGNGWYRVSISATPSATATTVPCVLLATSASVNAYTGDGSSGIFIWGAQFEISSSVSTYEPNPKVLTSYEVGSDGLIQTTPFASIDLPNLYPKLSFAYKANDVTFYRGGSSIGTDTSVTLPSSLNRLVIGGSAISSGRELNGTIKRLVYWPLRLTNSSQSTITS